MSGRTLLLTSAVALSLVAAPAAAQDPAGKAPASAPRADPAPAASGPDFPAGAEVLSVDGEPLGVLAYVDALGGERLLHIRRPDGTGTTAPAVVASRGERAGLWVTDIEILRLHYAETVKAWRERFEANRAEIAALYDERFCRMWEFYLCLSEVAFRHRGCMVFQIQLSKRVDAVPLTRDYIQAP